MKKYALYLLIVLGMTTTSWGAFACVVVPACTPCDENVRIDFTACIPYNCDDTPEVDYCVRGNMVVVDIVYDCEDCRCGGRTTVRKHVCVPLCPGVYSVLVRISVNCDDGCWSFGPRVAAIGSAFFKVCSCDPCPSPWSLPQWPCGGCCPDGDGPATQ